DITINSKVYGFKTLNIGGNEEKLILNIGKIETDIETEEITTSYKFTYDEIEKELKDSIGTVKLAVDLNSDENKIEEEVIFGEVSLEGNAVLILNENGNTINKLSGNNGNNLIMVPESNEENVPITIRKTIDTTRNIKIGVLNIQELLKTSEGMEELNKQAIEGKKYPVIKYEAQDGEVSELLKNINSFDYDNSAENEDNAENTENTENENFEKFEFSLFADKENSIIYQTIEQNLLSEYLYIMRFKDEFFKKGTVNGDYTLAEIKDEYLNDTANVINKETYDSSWSFEDAIDDFMNKYKFNGNDTKGDNNLIIFVNENNFENENNKNVKKTKNNKKTKD
ncbi:MAG: hypothetical protein K2L15_03705, partial [Eubacteriales bacterium]|nr:hypothetical protein [Eubacteriales bacterium]